jgi:4-hydroxybenzoate decarboxylase subunit C
MLSHPMANVQSWLSSVQGICMSTPESAPKDLREFLDRLRREREVVEIDAEVDPILEAPEIHRRVIAAGGPALLFNRPRGAEHRLVTNLFGTARRVEMAFGSRPRALIEELARIPVDMLPPTPGKIWEKRGLFRSLLGVGMKTRGRAPVSEVIDTEPQLSRLPALKTWFEDGGPFVTLPLVYTEPLDSGPGNLGMYRLQVHDDRHTGMHFQISKGGGYHFGEAEKSGRNLPAHVFLGGPPALILAAIAPLPENVPEMLFASLVLGGKMPISRDKTTGLPMPAQAEFCLSGEILAHERWPEGPFGDHYGYYSLRHDYPVFRVDRLHRRRDAIYPATVVGKPRQEDFFIGDFLQDLLSPLFPLVMPNVLDLWSYGETGYHALAGARIKPERYRREAMTTAFRILGEGQLALTKFLLVTDAAVDLRDFRATLTAILERADLRTDLHVFSALSMDTLDYTGPVVNEGSKGLLIGVGEPRRGLPREFEGQLPPGFGHAATFCPGCLAIDGPSYADDPDAALALTGREDLAPWPLVVLVDDARKTVRSAINFLWTVFMRFEPAADLHAAGDRVERHRRIYEAPIVIDARMKPDYPDELFCDPETAKLVSERWSEYFPSGMEMGDSDAAHLD